MMKGIYTPLSGSLAQEKVLEIIANNLANLNTTAFKGENVTFSVLDAEPEKNLKNPLPPANYKIDISKLMPLRGNEHQYVGVAGVQRDVSQGPIIQTQNPQDMAISGEGYFKLMTTDGVRFTRDGNFNISAEGLLVSKNGAPVQGEKGAIHVGNASYEVNSRGEIYQNGKFVDRLALQTFKDLQTLEKVGENQYIHNGTDENIVGATNYLIKQGSLEGSNVNAIKSMTSMILAHRSFEAYQKAVSNYDSMLDKSANTIGEVRA